MKKLFLPFVLIALAVTACSPKVVKPAEPEVEAVAPQIVTYDITFDLGKATLKPEAYKEISRIKDIMDKNPDVCFEVQGHCDNTGTDAVNDKLSLQRAEAIVSRLIELGIEPSRLSAVGKGSCEPIADNSTEEGRAKNRRVVFVKQ